MSHLSSKLTVANKATVVYEPPKNNIATVALNIVNTNDQTATTSVYFTDGSDWRVTDVEVTAAGKGYTRMPELVVTPAVEGATFNVRAAMDSVTLNLTKAGKGYQAGDILNVPVVSGYVTPQLKVTAVDADGAITNFGIHARGSFYALSTDTPSTTSVPCPSGNSTESAEFTMTLRLDEIAAANLPESGVPRETTFEIASAIHSEKATVQPTFEIVTDRSNAIEWGQSIGKGEVLYRTGFIMKAGQALVVVSDKNDVACNVWGIPTELSE